MSQYFEILLNSLCLETHHFFFLFCLKHLRGISISGRHLFRIYAVSILKLGRFSSFYIQNM